VDKDAFLVKPSVIIPTSTLGQSTKKDGESDGSDGGVLSEDESGQQIKGLPEKDLRPNFKSTMMTDQAAQPLAQ